MLWSSSKRRVVSHRFLVATLRFGFFDHLSISTEKNYASFVLARLFEKEGSPLEKTVASTMLGGDSFIEKITEEYLGVKKKNRDLPAIRELKRIVDIDLIYEEARVLLGDSNRVSKNAALFICHLYSGKMLKEIGEYFGISESAVSLASSRFNQKMKWNRKLRKSIDLIIIKLNLH